MRASSCTISEERKTGRRRGVSLDVAEGELVALLGPSGCGKTTTLRMIAGFIEATTGAILIGGRDVTHLPPIARDTGMVFQGYAALPAHDRRENVAFGSRCGGSKKRNRGARRRALRLVRPRVRRRMPRELSGGSSSASRWRGPGRHPPSSCSTSRSQPRRKLRHEVRIEIRQLQQRLADDDLLTHDQEEALTLATVWCDEQGHHPADRQPGGPL